MSAVTHVTEWGLVHCARGSLAELIDLDHRRDVRESTVACDGSSALSRGSVRPDVVLVDLAPTRIPTCPRCAVLRDEALEGRLPVREAKR